MVSKAFVVVCLFFALVFVEGQSLDKDEDLDLPDVLTNDKLLIPYFMCLLNVRKCTPNVTAIRGKQNDYL